MTPDPLIITVAPNGAYKQPVDHNALPITPADLARGLGVGGSGAELLSEDVPPGAGHQVTAVLGGGEAAVGDPDDLAEGPVPQVVLDLADQRRVGGVPGPGPDPHRDPVPGHGHPDHDLGQVLAVVLGVAVRPEPHPVAVLLVPVADRLAVLHHREAFAVSAVAAPDQAGRLEGVEMTAQLPVSQTLGAEAEGFVAGIDGEEGGGVHGHLASIRALAGQAA